MAPRAEPGSDLLPPSTGSRGAGATPVHGLTPPRWCQHPVPPWRCSGWSRSPLVWGERPQSPTTDRASRSPSASLPRKLPCAGASAALCPQPVPTTPPPDGGAQPATTQPRGRAGALQCPPACPMQPGRLRPLCPPGQPCPPPGHHRLQHRATGMAGCRASLNEAFVGESRRGRHQRRFFHVPPARVN